MCGMVGSHDFNLQTIKLRVSSQIPEPLLVFISKCPLKVQIFQGLGPFLQIELLTTGRMTMLLMVVTGNSRSCRCLRWLSIGVC